MSEEYEKDKQIILNAYKEGLPVRRIEARFGYSRSYISKIKNVLIAGGLITEEEISIASAKYYKENPNAQGLNKTKVSKPKDRKKAEARHEKSLEKRNKVLELVKQGKSISQIARELQVSPTSVSWNIDILIKECKIKKEDVVKLSSQAEVGFIDKSDPNYIMKRDSIIKYLEQGWKGHNIRKMLDITTYEFDIFMRDIREKRIMTSEQIKLARERKKQEDLQFVANSVHSKLTITQMRQLRPDFSYNEITPMIKELIKKGIITQEEVEENRKQGFRRTINRTVKMTPEEQTQFILDKVQKGYSPKEILDSDTTQSLTMHKILYQKRQLINKGYITKEQADRVMKERTLQRRSERKNEIKENHLKDLERLKEQLKNPRNETMKTAINALGFSVQYAYKIRNIGIQNGIWLTEEELRQIEKNKKQRQKRNQNKRKKQQELERARVKKENEDAKKAELYTFRTYVEQGYNFQEITKLMNYSIAYIYQLRRRAVENNMWFSKEAIDEFRQIRQKREERKKRAEQKKEETRQKREIAVAKKEMKKAEEIAKAMENERKRKIRGYAEDYKKYRKMAKKEDKMEFYGEEDVSTEGRKNFIPILVKLHKLDADIPDNDIQIVLNAFEIYPEMADAASIKFLISDANKRGGIKAAEKMAIYLGNTLKNTQFHKPLIEYRRWIAKRALLPKIKEFKEQGMSNTDIGEKLGITSLDVFNILENTVKIKFPGEPDSR